MLEVRRAMRRELIFRNRINPLEVYDDLELIERFRFDSREGKSYFESKCTALEAVDWSTLKVSAIII
jgi:virulence-associated protein VapD